ncbi:hypothetical protein D3C87_1484190 [compost metagenome]
MFHGHQDRAAPLAPHGDALQEAHADEQHGCPISNAVVRRDQSDEDRGDAHQKQRDQQHRLASDAVAEMAEDDAAQRPREEPDRIRGKSRQGAGDRVKGGKEDLVEDQRGGRAVQKIVVPLDSGSHEAGNAGRNVLARLPLATLIGLGVLVVHFVFLTGLRRRLTSSREAGRSGETSS